MRFISNTLYMDSSLQGRRPNEPFSQASGSQYDMRSVDVDSSPLNQEGCSHFSIRGYVADVRKNDRKICWPFDELHDHLALEKHENLLPPLSVAKFIWWDCKNCLASHSIWSQQMLLLHSSVVGGHGLFKSHPFKEGKNQIQVKPVTNEVSYYGKFEHPCNQKYGGQKSIKANMFVTESMHSDEGKCFASTKNESSTQKNKNLHKKGQKIRMLNDIMENEILETAKKIPSCDKQGCSAIVQPKNDFCSKSDVFKVQKDNAGSPKENIKMMKNKKTLHKSEIEDNEGFPLMQWTNRISEKAKTVGLADLERKLAEHVILLPPKSAESIPSEKLMDITKTDQKGKKQDRVLDDELCNSGKDQVVDKDGAQKPNNYRITLTKSARNVLGKRVMNSELTAFHDRPHKKGRSKKQCRDAKCYPIHGSKKFLSTSENEKKVQIGGSKSFQNISEKPSTEKSNQTSDSAVVDGIPVGILKLLQENWIKRRLVNGGECSNQSMMVADSSEKITKSVEDGNPLIWTNNNRDEIQNTQSKPCAVTHEIPTNQSGWNSYSSALGGDAGLPGNAIEYSRHDLNFGDIRTLPLIDSIDGNSPNHKQAIQNLDSSKDGPVWGHNSYRAYPLTHQSSTMPSGMRNPSEILHRHHLTSRPRSMVLGKGKLTGCSSAIPLQKRSNRNFHPSNYSLFNGYNARTMLPPPPPPRLDINKNDTVSAMHLLKLMDPAISSNAPSCSSMDEGPNSFPMNHDFSHVCDSQRKHQMLIMHNHHNFHRNHHNPGMITSDFCFQPPRSAGVHEPTFPMDNIYSEENYRQSSSLMNYANAESMISQRKKKKLVEVFGLANENCGISMISQRKRRKSVEVLRMANENCEIGLCCVLNRNPADFTISDESNEYMISGYDELRMLPNYQQQQQNQRVMKLTALKDLLRNYD